MTRRSSVAPTLASVRAARARRGGVLVITLIAMLLAVSLAFAATSLSRARSGEVVKSERDQQARAAAESGVHRALAWATELAALDPGLPFAGIDALAGTLAPDGTPQPFVLADGEAITSGGRTYGSFTVEITSQAQGETRELRITSTGHVRGSGVALAKATAHTVARLARRPAPALEHAYFVDHWAWLLSDKITLWGNGGSNGQFDCGGRKPTVNAMPRFDAIGLADPAHPDLLLYRDDNGDGLQDGADGGIFSAWDIVGASQVRGTGGEARNQHAFGEPTALPQLGDLRGYETTALQLGSSIEVGGGIGGDGSPQPPIQLCDEILGDESGEPQNLVLIGTTARPIILDGPVVVRGDVILKGVITGRGSIFAGGNLYIADDVTYANAPTSWPSQLDEAGLEAWLAANVGADFCGLYARENVVIGDFTNSGWQSRVDRWLSDPANDCSEDAGADGIPHTRDGKDGIAGTADDDLLEGDGAWTVEHYTELQAQLGLLPPGKTVGDPIPGSGEDLDGDGLQDGAITLSDFDLAAALDSGDWAGNLPPGTVTYDELASTTVTTVEALVATAHAAAMSSVAYGSDFHLRGGLVARIETMLATTKSMQFWQDPRLLGGGLFPELAPQVVMTPEIVAWQWTSEDLHEVIAARGRVSP